MGLVRICKPSGWVSGIGRYGLVLLAGLLVAACQNQTPPDQRLARFVDEVMFGGSIDDHVFKEGRVAKWRGNVSVAVTGADAEAYRPRVSAQIDRFSRLSGLDVRMADIAHVANLKIMFVRRDDFLINRERVPCFAWVQTDSSGIVAARISISTADANLIDHCLSHELMHAFGLLYHSGIVRSTLSPAHQAAQLTPWDELALRVLYDTRLELAADRADVAPVIQKIVSELIAGS